MASHPTETSAAMDCAELTRTLDAYLDRELAPEEQAEAAAHLADCEPCRAAVEAEVRVRGALRAHLRAAMGPGTPVGTAPDALRARIHEALSRQRRPWLRRVLSPVPLAALAACAAGVLVVLVTSAGSDPLVEEAILKHARGLPLEVTAGMVGPDAVGGWFAGKLDFNVAPPRFAGAGAQLVGARLMQLKDHPAAYVRYDLPRGHLGLFIVDDPSWHLHEAGRVRQVGPATVRLINARGFNVAVWRRHEIVYSLVSDLDEDDLVRLVQTAQGAGADR